MGIIRKQLRSAIVLSLLLWLVVGVAYPLVMTGVSQLVFPYQASGSQVIVGGKLVGVRHVGQYYKTTDAYFWSRPSATVSVSTGKPEPYNAFNSAPSNLGPTNAKLIQHIRARVAFLLKHDPGLNAGQIPLSLVESSGSGLDPNISVQSAMIQIPRVAAHTGLSAAALQADVKKATSGPQWGVFGRRRVNVLQLNVLVYEALRK